MASGLCIYSWIKCYVALGYELEWKLWRWWRICGDWCSICGNGAKCVEIGINGGIINDMNEKSHLINIKSILKKLLNVVLCGAGDVILNVTCLNPSKSERQCITYNSWG